MFLGSDGSRNRGSDLARLFLAGWGGSSSAGAGDEPEGDSGRGGEGWNIVVLRFYDLN